MKKKFTIITIFALLLIDLLFIKRGLTLSSIYIIIYGFSKLHKSKYNKIDKVFIAIFTIILFIPMMKISNKNISEKENRMLAKYPSLFSNNQFNWKYFSQFNDWFNDHFWGRRQYIHPFSSLSGRWSLMGNIKVLKGANNWLFYKRNNSLDNFQNKTLLTDEELKIIAEYLSNIDEWCRKHNKSFYYFIAPDKNKVYGEHITILKKLRPDSESRANQLINYLRKNTKVNVIYPIDTLLKNKKKGLLYYKHDTHWNLFGAYFGYLELIKQIQKKYKQVQPIKYSKLETSHMETGDLDPMINYNVPKDKSEYFIPVIDKKAVCKFNAKDKDKKKGFECSNKSKKLNAIIFRDSFTISLEEYLSNTFNKMKFEWKAEISSEDKKDILKNFDIVILENVERYIPTILNLKFSKE